MSEVSWALLTRTFLLWAPDARLLTHHSPLGLPLLNELLLGLQPIQGARSEQS